MSDVGLAGLTAIEASRRLAGRSISCTELVKSCLARIEAREPRVHAWAHLDPQNALDQARERDAEQPRSALHGIPVGIKDIIDTRGMRTSRGSPLYAQHIPAADAQCVATLRACGAVILGKTATTEFAYFHPAATTNPLDPARTPGGSSSGSAAAVADCHVALALGTQTAGSIVRPASFNGLVGLKPTWGDLSLVGVQPFAPSLDTLGVLSRGVRDAAFLLSFLSGRSADYSPNALQPTRVALVRSAHWDSAEPHLQKAILGLASVVREQGIEFDEIDLDPRGELTQAQLQLMAYESVQSLGATVDNHTDQVSGELKEIIRVGRAIPESAIRAASELRARTLSELASLFKRVTLLLTPSSMGEAPLGLARTGDPIFNRVWTFLGLPCVSLPLARGPHGMPLGVQLVGPAAGDATLLRHAAFIEQLIGYERSAAI